VTRIADQVSALQVARSDGTGLRTFYSLPAERGIRSPAWSPDGSRIAFASIDGIYVTDVFGKQTSRLTHYEGPLACDDGRPTWSPDGRTIVFEVRCDGSELGLWAVNANGAHRR